MTRREFAVLDAMNIATTRHHHPKRGYEATAQQVALVLCSDPRLQEHGFVLSSRQVGEVLKAMGQDWPRRREALVRKVGSRRWRLTEAGVRVLGA